jgi:hypothetical protein
MKMRHELKYIINHVDYLLLKSRFIKLLSPDHYAYEYGEYRVRSFYFDTPFDHALLAKVDGVDQREKFRFRLYNGDSSLIRLEKKIRRKDLIAKESVVVSKEQVNRLQKKDIEWLRDSEEPLLIELYSKMRGQQLQPRTIIEYKRAPFVYPCGNVRLTLDRDIRTGVASQDFFSDKLCLLNTFDAYAILEVKYDNFLPDFIKQIIQIAGRPRVAFSKYAASRKYD